MMSSDSRAFQMVFRTGIDICDVRRMRRVLRRRPAARVDFFSPAEIAYCDRQPDPMPHFAARFAAKEALIKAFGLDLLTFDLPLIELAHAVSGRPSLHITCPRLIAAAAADLGGERFDVAVSVSHETDYAVASVVVWRL